MKYVDITVTLYDTDKGLENAVSEEFTVTQPDSIDQFSLSASAGDAVEKSINRLLHQQYVTTTAAEQDRA